MSDVSTFLSKSFTDLDLLNKNQLAQKGDIRVDPNFKPLSLNVRKALEIVKKFELQWPGLQDQKPIKFFANGEPDQEMAPASTAQGLSKKTIQPGQASTKLPPMAGRALPK